MNHNSHIMLTLLGVNPQSARYTLGAGKEFEAELAPVALLELLPESDKPNKVIALCTSRAKNETWPKLKDALDGRYDTEMVGVPDGSGQEDVDEFLQAVAGAIPSQEGIALTVDVTHGFRHFSFLTYIAALYLSALRKVSVKGAYYGMLNRDAPSPFLDLRPLLDLPQWVHALNVLSDTGSALPLAKLLSDSSHGQSSLQVSTILSAFSDAYLSGLPLETALQAKKMDSQFRPVRRLLTDARLPLADELRRQLFDFLKEFYLDGEVSEKGSIALSEAELNRQASIIDDLLERGHTATALGLMNEWTISWAIWNEKPDSHWLEYHATRRRASNALGALRTAFAQPGLNDRLSEDQRGLAEFWRDLSELRNGYNHHGMRRQELVGDDKTNSMIAKVRGYWQTTLSRLPNFPVSIGDSIGGRVLVSPIGLRPGALFSALKACRSDTGEYPKKCLVICSRDTQSHIDEALNRAGYAGEALPLLLEDPYGGGKDEIERLAKYAQIHLVGADEVVVNITGGTTLMGLVADAVASQARWLASPTRRFGLIDRRPPAEQQADPYQVGEVFWLDGVEDGDGY